MGQLEVERKSDLLCGNAPVDHNEGLTLATLTEWSDSLPAFSVELSHLIPQTPDCIDTVIPTSGVDGRSCTTITLFPSSFAPLRSLATGGHDSPLYDSHRETNDGEPRAACDSEAGRRGVEQVERGESAS